MEKSKWDNYIKYSEASILLMEFSECTTNINRRHAAMTRKRQPAICGHHTAMTTKSLAWNMWSLHSNDYKNTSLRRGHHTAMTTKSLAWNTWSLHTNDYKNTSLRHVVTIQRWLQNHWPETRGRYTAMTTKTLAWDTWSTHSDDYKNTSLRHVVNTQRWLQKH